MSRMSRESFIGWAVCGVCTAAILVVLGQVAFLQTSPDPRLRPWVSDHTRTTSIETIRGDILDRSGRPLATALPAARVVIDPVALDRGKREGEKLPAERLEEIILKLALALNVPTEDFAPTLRAAIAGNRSLEISSKPATSTDGDDVPPIDRLVAAFSREAGDEPGYTGPEKKPKGTVRYVAVGPPMTMDRARAVRQIKLADEFKLRGVFIEPWPLRVYAGPDAIRPIVGKVEFHGTGVAGVERSSEAELLGMDGRLRFIRDASGDPLWIKPGGVEPLEQGRDIRLSIDTLFQQLVEEELAFGVEQADAAGGRAVVIDPATGEVLAMTDVLRPGITLPAEGLRDYPFVDAAIPRAQRPEAPQSGRFRILREEDRASTEPALWRNRCVLDAYEPGSTFKGFVWGLAHAAGVMTPGEIIDGTGKDGRVLSYGRRIRDVTRRTELDWDGVLVYSSNVGMALAADRMSRTGLRSALEDMGFGQRTRLGLPGEHKGLLQGEDVWTDWTQTSVSFGQEIAVTPVQLVRAFAAFARNGNDAGTIPDLRLTAADPLEPGTGIRRRVMPAASALAARELMKIVAERMETNTLAFRPERDQDPQYTLFGKSGTAQVPLVPPKGKVRPRGAIGYYPSQYFSSFLAAAPADDPRLVVLVLIEDPGPAKVRIEQHYGSWVAGPVVQRIVERLLPELGVPPDRPIDDVQLGG
ncbi:MAG: penicillin-binding protein 2 [Planctomycetota bacterium]